MGIDIGTTTVSIVVVYTNTIENKDENQNKNQNKSKNKNKDQNTYIFVGSETACHHAFFKLEKEFHKVQDPEKIWTITSQLISRMIEKYGKPDVIGMTGQMHGILYVNEYGQAVSPFYTWQDGCGDEVLRENMEKKKRREREGKKQPEKMDRLMEQKEEKQSQKQTQGETYAEFLKRKVGMTATGYGMTTNFYLQENGQIPQDAKKMVTISDYIAMKLCGKKEAFVAKDMAASWGCFDMRRGDFEREKLEQVGMDIGFLPEVLQSHEIIGMTKRYSSFYQTNADKSNMMKNDVDKIHIYKANIHKDDADKIGEIETQIEIPENIPVVASIGDNQASVLGSVQDLENTVLVNIGTGSQVSVGTSDYQRENLSGSIEIRPCLDKYLVVGSSLCGGRAYAMLEKFYREVARMFQEESEVALKKEDGKRGEQEENRNIWKKENERVLKEEKYQNSYSLMEKQAREFLKRNGKESSWKIKTAFAGTRDNPMERGEISGIYTENFHPGAMTVGMIRGILEELYEMYEEICQITKRRAKYLVGSGNGIRKNSLMREMAEEIFQMPMKVQECEEEAAYGAAVQALVKMQKVGGIN